MLDSVSNLKILKIVLGSPRGGSQFTQQTVQRTKVAYYGLAVKTGGLIHEENLQHFLS